MDEQRTLKFRLMLGKEVVGYKETVNHAEAISDRPHVAHPAYMTWENLDVRGRRIKHGIIYDRGDPYTGFNDSTRTKEFPDGKEIYENDELEVSSYDPIDKEIKTWLGIVVWNPKRGSWWIERQTSNDSEPLANIFCNGLVDSFNDVNDGLFVGLATLGDLANLFVGLVPGHAPAAQLVPHPACRAGLVLLGGLDESAA